MNTTLEPIGANGPNHFPPAAGANDLCPPACGVQQPVPRAGSAAARVGPSSISLLFCVPVTDQKEFAQKLSQTVQGDIQLLLSLLRQIHAAPKKKPFIIAAALRFQGRRGFSAESLTRKYYLYTRGGSVGGPNSRTFSAGDWRCLIDRAQAGPDFWATDDEAGLPDAFIEFWKSLCERNQRKTAPARRDLLDIWRTHYGRNPANSEKIHFKSIPGYETWPDADPYTGRPVGWSDANLNRNAPAKFELAAARQGRDASAAYSRKVFTTRHGLRVGQFYIFDDQEYDTAVNFPGSSKAMRPVGLNCIDMASACCIAWGIKPVLIDDDGTKKKGLAKHMPFLVAHILCNIGYLPGRTGVSPSEAFTTLIVEAGSATLNRLFIGRLLTATNDQVRVHVGKTSNTPSFPGLFEGASKGNPRFKSHIESFFNLVRNEFAALPGAVGMDRNHAPAEFAGRQRYNERLLKLADTLSPERRALLHLPFLDFTRFVEIACELYSRINNRTEHDLEGWERCGHVVQELCLDPDLFPSLPAAHFSEKDWLALPAEKRTALKPFVNSRARLLSPQEVWNANATGLQKLGSHMIPSLLGPELGIERRVQKGYITIEDQDLGPDIFRFPVGSNVAEGQTFLTYQNPFAPDQLILADDKGRYLGAIDRQIIPTRADVDQVHAQIKYAAAEEAKRLAPSAARALPLAQAKLDMHRHNKAVLHGQPITAAELAAADELRTGIKTEGRQALDDLLKPSPDLAPILSESDLKNLTQEILQ